VRRLRQYSLRSLLVATLICAIVVAWYSRGYRRRQQFQRDMQTLSDMNIVFNVHTGDGQISSMRAYGGLGSAERFDKFCAIAERQPRLRGVSACWSDLSEAQVARLLALPVKALMIEQCSAGGTLRAEASPTLTRLGLPRTRIDDHSLAALGELPNVEHLDLTRTRVSDRSIDYLAGRKRLKLVILARCKVTAEGAQRLRRLRPDMKVGWEPLR